MWFFLFNRIPIAFFAYIVITTSILTSDNTQNPLNLILALSWYTRLPLIIYRDRDNFYYKIVLLILILYKINIIIIYNILNLTCTLGVHSWLPVALVFVISFRWLISRIASRIFSLHAHISCHLSYLKFPVT